MKSLRYYLLGFIYVLCAPLLLAVQYINPVFYATCMFYLVHGFNWRLANAWATVFKVETGSGKSTMFKQYHNYVGMHLPSKDTLANGSIIGDGGKLATFRCQWDGAYETYLYQKRWNMKLPLVESSIDMKSSNQQYLLNFFNMLVEQKYSTTPTYGGILNQNSVYFAPIAILGTIIAGVFITGFLFVLLVKLIRYAVRKRKGS